MEFKFFIYIPLGWRRKYCGVFELEKDGVIYYFIDNEYYFGDPYLYKWNDLERFAFFDKAALEILKHLDWKPDIIHCHDWQTGMVPVLLNAYYNKDTFYSGNKKLYLLFITCAIREFTLLTSFRISSHLTVTFLQLTNWSFMAVRITKRRYSLFRLYHYCKSDICVRNTNPDGRRKA